MDLLHYLLIAIALFFLYKWIKTRKDAKQLAAFCSKYRNQLKQTREQLRLTKASSSGKWAHLYAKRK